MRLSGTVYSEVLGMDTGITVVTPKNFQEKKDYKKDYYVVYLLHGLHGNSKSWLEYSMLPTYAAGGNAIYILPEVARSFYSDMKYGFLYYTYITQELPVICQNVFHVSAEREKTAIMGNSMGGYGALKCALSKPEQYGMCAAFSSCCLFIREEVEEAKKNGLPEKYRERFGKGLERDFLVAFGENLELKPEDVVWELARGLKDSAVRPRLYMSCGTKDPFYQAHLQFWKGLEQLGIACEHEEWEAYHDFICFDEALKRAIQFFGL